MILLYVVISYLLVLLFNKIYFFFNKKIIFFKYFINVNIYSFIIILLLNIFKKNFFIIINNQTLIIFSALVINYYLFIFSFLLTIGLKSLNSPTYDIFKIIKNNKTSLKILIYKIKKKKIIHKRIKDLINQGLIKKDGKTLTFLGYSSAIFFSIVKKVFNLKSQG